MRVGIYARISRDDDADGLGVLRQERLCREYAAARGWDVVEVYCDNDASASSYASGTRSSFERLLRDARAGLLDRIVVLAQDRLVRRPEQLEDILKLLSDVSDLGVECVLGGSLDALTSAGRIQARIKVVFDAAYSDFISERVSLKKRELAERGLPPGGGARPFGYVSGGMEVDEAEAVLIREAAWILAGQSLYVICDDWESRGIRSAQGRRWRSGVLRKVMESPRIAGLRAYRGEILTTAAWPPVFDLTTYARLCAHFAARDRRRGGRPPLVKHLLSGIAQCGRCQRPLFSNVIAGKRYYVCRRLQSRSGCGRLGIQAEPVERYVTERLLEDGLRRAAAVADSAPHRQLEDDRATLDVLAVRRFVQGGLTAREYEAARAELLARISEVEHHIAICELAMQEQVTNHEQWAKLSAERQRDIAHRRIASLIVLPASRRGGPVDLRRVDLALRR
jgi:DNA invertase Pin-like site-specific DNA recombinase